ncbi:uncharacterized protein LOC141882545 isoform X1 [Acropora palmata]|uniref:uncharacterized protein LOC141882545 isoform X1 n=1 Tax=Acropora palmata TaxID=6131 RepID=UPI003D9FFB99
MAGDLNSRKITILLDESKVEELSGWLTVNNGEIVRVDKPRKKNSTPGSQLHLQNEENRSRSRHKVEGFFCRCTIFRLAKPAFFRYNENFTLVRDFYVAYFVISEISKNN